jgi:hypothetical protein
MDSGSVGRRRTRSEKLPGFGLRTLLIATRYLGFNYDVFYISGGQPNHKQQNDFKIPVHRSRLRGLLPLQGTDEQSI